MFGRKREKSELQNKVIEFANRDEKVDLNFFEDIGLFSYKSEKLKKVYFQEFI